MQKPKDDETTHSHSEARPNSWRDKPLHGKFLSIAEGQPQETERNFQWLVSGELKITSEALIVAAQDQALPTRNIQAKLYHSADSPKCQQCGKKDETVSGCEMLANSDYLNRHNHIASQIHWALCGKYGFNISEQWWQHKVETVLEIETSKNLWELNIYSDWAIHHCRPDIVLIDKVDNRVKIIDTAVPWDANIKSKYREKVDHYKDLAIELSKLWQKQVIIIIIPVIVGSLGCVKSNLDKALKDLSIEVKCHSYTL